jgi:FtsZ-binding cell division protein ZapB
METMGDDEMNEKERIAELERENKILKENYHSVIEAETICRHEKVTDIESKYYQLQKENSYLKEELEAISEVLPHHVGRNETGVSIIDDVKDLTKEALEFASIIKKLEKENSELKGKIERAMVGLEKIAKFPLQYTLDEPMKKIAKQTLSELKGEK